MASSLVNSVVHWRKKLERNTDEDVILNVIHKLSKVPMSESLLQETSIGKAIHMLSKKPGKIGVKATTVLNKWREVLLSDTKTSEVVKHKSKHSSDKSKSDKKSSDHSPTKIKKNETDSKHNHVNGNGISKPPVKNTVKSENVPHLNGSSAEKKAKGNEHGNGKSSKHSVHESKRKSEASNTSNGMKVKKPKTESGVEKLSNHDLNKKSHISNSQVITKESSALKTHSHKHSKASSENPSPKKAKKTKDSEESGKAGLKAGATEAFTASEALFEDCLNFSDVVKVKKKKSVKSSSGKKEKPNSIKENTSEKIKSHTSAPSTSKSQTPEKKSRVKNDVPNLLSQPCRNSLPKLNEVDILSTLPQPQPNYRPLPPRNNESCDNYARRKVLSNEDAIKFTSSRRERTNVYSGRKNIYYTEVPSLFQSCIRILIENIKAIEYMGGAPYFLLKPVLERATPPQLENIEHFNPYILDDTHELWELHCKRDFRCLEPGENETWRDLYWRAHDDRERRLQRLAKNITENISKSTPVRSVKLAYVDSVVKPPRDVARRQAKNGTALPVNRPMKAGPPSKATPRPSAPAINAAASNVKEFIPKKPKIAPLMAKTLKSMKQCFRR